MWTELFREPNGLRLQVGKISRDHLAAWSASRRLTNANGQHQAVNPCGKSWQSSHLLTTNLPIQDTLKMN